MKKILLFLLICLMLISSTSFAQERTQQERQKRIAVFSAAQTVEQNRASIKLMSEEAKEKVRATKIRIKNLLENKEDLSKDQLVFLREALTQIKGHQDSLKDTFGQIKAYNEAIKVAREHKDFDQLLVLYNQIIVIQELRISDLSQFNEILDGVLNTL